MCYYHQIRVTWDQSVMEIYEIQGYFKFALTLVSKYKYLAFHGANLINS